MPDLNRREFIHLLATAAAAYPLSSLAEKRQNLAKETLPVILSDPWLTLSVVQEHLFPAEKNSPGARDIQALTYLRNMMKTPDFDPEEALLIQNGVGWLNDLATQQYAKKFIELNTDAKETILRRIENSRAGSRWLSRLLSYILEALLSDPVYGGNPSGTGWAWLHHQPGFPRPTKDKKYFKLRQQTRRVTKA